MEKLDIINAQKNIQSYINMIKKIQLSKQVNFIKWKNYENQVVIQTNDFYYKIYQIDSIKIFDSYIRLELGKIYRQKYDIIWDIYTVQQDGIIYQIQQRQKLQVLKENQYTQQEILQSWNNILVQLQKNLKLQLILKQLQFNTKFSDIIKLKLVRQCILKSDDYAIKNNQVFLLDDTDWFIAMINKQYQWAYKVIDLIDVQTKYGQLYFAPINYIDLTKILKYKADTKYNRWYFLNLQQKDNKIKLLDFKQQRQLHLQNKLLSLFNYQNKLLLNNQNNNKLIN